MSNKRPKFKKYLTVSIHDVTPKFKGELSEIVSELDQRCINSKNILVIPNHESYNDISADDNFVSWLHQLSSGGNELVQHGYEHVSRNRTYNSMGDWFMGNFFAQGSAEFQNIGYDEAREIIRRGKDIFQNAEINSKGFAAPAWLINPKSERAIIDEGFVYMPLINRFRIFSQGDIKSEVVGFTPRPIVDYLFRAYNKYLASAHLRKRTLARVDIHPQDMWGKGIFDYALKIIDELRQDRELVTYSEFVKSRELHQVKEV
ncbi:MAG: DUF2334 domain-containing protein [archaeon]